MIRSFFLSLAVFIFGLSLFGLVPNAMAAGRCNYSCNNPSGGSTPYQPVTNAPSCNVDGDCTRARCTDFCNAHRPSGAESVTLVCATGWTADCRTITPPATSPTGSTATGGATGGTPSGTGTGTGSATDSPIAPMGSGRVGPGHCAYQCRSGGTVRDIGQTVSCAQDSDCAADCSARCPLQTPPGSRDGNGLGAFTGTCVTPTPPPHCILPAATTPTGGAGATAGGSSTPSGAGAPVETLTNPLGTTNPIEIFGRVVKAVLGLVGAMALFWFVWGGILWMTARGEPGQVKDGQGIIKNAALGILLIFFSYLLTSAFLSVFEGAASSPTTPSASKTSSASS